MLPPQADAATGAMTNQKNAVDARMSILRRGRHPTTGEDTPSTGTGRFFRRTVPVALPAVVAGRTSSALMVVVVPLGRSPSPSVPKPAKRGDTQSLFGEGTLRSTRDVPASAGGAQAFIALTFCHDGRSLTLRHQAAT